MMITRLIRLAASFLAIVGVTVALAACGSETPPGSTDVPTGGPAETPAARPGDPAPASAGELVGPENSACALPVSFTVARGWQAQAPSGGPTQGGAELLCEIDGKPAGHLGYVHVWHSDEADAMTALSTFATDRFGAGHQYTEPIVDRQHAAEVSYVERLEDVEIDQPTRALALPVSNGTVLIATTAPNEEEFQANLPAYVLAKNTVRSG